MTENIIAKRSHFSVKEISSDLAREGCVELDYSNSSFDDLDAGILASRFFVNRTVSRIDLSNTKITDYGIRRLADVLKDQPLVRTLVLSNNDLGESSVLALAELKANRDINVIGVELPQEQLAEALTRRTAEHSSGEEEVVAPSGQQSWAERGRSTTGRSVNR